MRTILPLLMALMMLLVAVPASAANDPQSGTGTTCAEYNALFVVDAMTGLDTIVVDGGTGYEITTDMGVVHIDFYSASGAWMDYHGKASVGTVPIGAAFGVVCVGLGYLYPEVPLVEATWTYQDGF